MGIRGLKGWINWIASETIQQTVEWSEFKHKRIGVDILGFLYKVKANNQCVFTYLARLIAAFRSQHITPVMIFDGKPPLAKQAALKQRSTVRAASKEKLVAMDDSHRSAFQTIHLRQSAACFSSEERDIVKQFFYACGVLCLNATHEADDVLAYFARRGEIAAVISNDFDLLARGVERLLVPEYYALPGDVDGWSCYTLSSIVGHVGFNYVQFLEMCVLMGCDYTTGCMQLPYKSAYWAIKYRGSLTSTLRVLGIAEHAPYYAAMERLAGLRMTRDALMGEKQWAKYASFEARVECDALAEFRHSRLSGLDDMTFCKISTAVATVSY